MFFGWYVVAGTFVAQMFVVGFFTYSVSLLVPLVREEFGVSMEQVMYSLTAGTFGGMVLMPLVGVMLDRYPVRWIMAVGTLLFAVGLWILAHTSSITQYIVVFGVTMSVAYACDGSAASQTTISRWFTSSRGRALGISAVGTSVGGIAIPALVTWWVQTSGWRTTLENLGLVIALIVLPFVILTIRGKPSDIGLLLEGGDAATAGELPGAELGLGDILRNPGYWYIGITLGLLFSVYTSILANISPYATGLGVSAAQASSLIMAVVVMGLAAGGMLPVWGALMARVFGLLSYGRAMGLMGPLITVSVMPGFAVVGRLFDATGSYRLCLLVFAGIIAVAAALSVQSAL